MIKRTPVISAPGLLPAGTKRRGIDNFTAVTRLCCGFLLSLFLTQPCIAHDSKHPEYDSWYWGLKNPNLKSVVQDLACCSARHCHETEAELRGGHWFARLGKALVNLSGPKWELTEWKEVPTGAILKVANPTGSPVICHSVTDEIWCFIPDNQY